MDNRGITINTSLCCGVPAKFHGTCCGWSSANWIVDPQTIEDKAAMWDRQKFLEASNGSNVVVINFNPTHQPRKLAAGCFPTEGESQNVIFTGVSF